MKRSCIMGISQIEFSSIKEEEDVDQTFLTMTELLAYEATLKAELKLCKQKYEDGENMIIEYFKAQLEEDPGFKLETLFGNVSKRKGKSWVYEDEKLILNQLELIEPSLVQTVTTKKFDKNEFKKRVQVTDDGDILLNDEVIDGVYVEEKQNISVNIK